jgi:hypothetical protein
MLKVAGFIIAGILLYFFLDCALEFRYWKNEQRQGVPFVKNVLVGR